MMALMHGSALETMFRQAEGLRTLAPFVEQFRNFGNSLLRDMTSNPRTMATVFRMRRAPQTDDMRQMLDDFGVSPANCEPSRNSRSGPLEIRFDMTRVEYRLSSTASTGKT